MPEKTKHCDLCGFCIQDFDHHCFYVNACVGKNNVHYFSFLLFYFVLFLILNSVSFAIVLMKPELYEKYEDILYFLFKFNLDERNGYKIFFYSISVILALSSAIFGISLMFF